LREKIHAAVWRKCQAGVSIKCSAKICKDNNYHSFLILYHILNKIAITFSLQKQKISDVFLTFPPNTAKIKKIVDITAGIYYNVYSFMRDVPSPNKVWLPAFLERYLRKD